MDNNPQSPTPPGPLPNMRPYQIPAAEKKARIEKESAERRQHIEELRKEAELADLGRPKKRHRFLRFMGWMLLIVVLTAGGGFAGWYFLLRSKTPAKSTAAVQQTTPSTDAAVATKHYQSTNFSLELDYPEAWVVTDNSTKLTIVSPAMQLKSASSANQKGQITLTIQNKQASTPAFKNGNAVAVRESEKIMYTKPSQTQRADSYVSFLNYAGSTSDGLDGVYVTGDNGYQTGQAIPQVDIAKADPLITVTFASCSDAKCADGGKAMTLASTAWNDTTFSKPIKAMLQSLIVQ